MGGEITLVDGLQQIITIKNLPGIRVHQQTHQSLLGVLHPKIFKILVATTNPKLDGIRAILKIRTTKVQEASAPGPAIKQLQPIPGSLKNLNQNKQDQRGKEGSYSSGVVIRM